MPDDILSFRLPYGRSAVFAGELLRKRVAVIHRPRRAIQNLSAKLSEALESPLEFPPLKQAFVPGDQVALVVDAHTPQLKEILRDVCQVVIQAGVEPAGISILQAATRSSEPPSDPRALLPAELQSAVHWSIHDPEQEELCAYLATTAAGERIYLSKQVIEADSVILIGPIEFDDLLGVRGPTGALFPGLSDLTTQRRFRGQGHEELSLEDVRPMAQMVDESAWLLGNQFSIGVVPGPGDLAGNILAGLTEAVQRTGKDLLQNEWRVNLPERAELVLLAVNADAGGHGWDQVCQAIDVGRRLVDRDGRIVVLSQLRELPGEALRIVGASHAPREALQALKKIDAPDRIAALQLARALDWANVYLLSELPPVLIEELYLLPLGGPQEVARLLEGDDLTAILCGAQHIHGRCRG